MGKNKEALTKAYIVERVHEKVGLSKKDINSIIECAFGILKETLQREDKIVISGFGNLVMRNKSPRRGRNPQTGENLEISARRVLTFKPSEVLRSSLNSSKEVSSSDRE